MNSHSYMPPKVVTCLEELVGSYQVVLGENLLGMYVHGSIAMNCFNEKSSDVDVLVVVQDKLETEARKALGKVHLLLSDKYEQNIELSVVTNSTLKHFIYPTPFEFHYSDDHKESFLNDSVELSSDKTDYDLAAHFVIVKKHGITLLGEPAEKVFPDVSPKNYLDSIVRDSEWSANNILSGDDEGECFVPKYAVLNFCRVLAFIKDDLITSKKTGAEWGINNLPTEFVPVINEAMQEYRVSDSSKPVSCKTLKNFANYAKGIIDEAISI